MDPIAALTAQDDAGRLAYLAEHLASMHASPDMPWLTGRFEFLGEKAVGAAMTLLALPDERGAFRASATASPRPAVARDLWEHLGVASLATNSAATDAFHEAERAARPITVPVAGLFGRTSEGATEDAIVAPVAFNREFVGAGVFVVETSSIAETLAGVLATHAAVAITQLRQREEARRLHSVDARLWVPDERFLISTLHREVTRARRYGREVGLALLRIENEPEIRARFGDFFTDHLMRRIGSQLQADVRESDVLGALRGGYAVIHTDTHLDGTRISAERLRDSVANMVQRRFPEAPAPNISLGVAAYPSTAADAEGLIAAVDLSEASTIAA